MSILSRIGFPLLACAILAGACAPDAADESLSPTRSESLGEPDENKPDDESADKALRNWYCCVPKEGVADAAFPCLQIFRFPGIATNFCHDNDRWRNAGKCTSGADNQQRCGGYWVQ